MQAVGLQVSSALGGINVETMNFGIASVTEVVSAVSNMCWLKTVPFFDIITEDGGGFGVVLVGTLMPVANEMSFSTIHSVSATLPC